MLRTRIKICGITRPQDAVAAAQAGADAIGLVFYQQSPRVIDVEAATTIAELIPPFVTRVGLFVNADEGFVESMLRRVKLDVLQFHGDESPDRCNKYDRPYIKAIRMQQNTNLRDIEKHYSGASALLLDTYTPGLAGGTGKTFDWGLVPEQLTKPVILAGGLTPENVADAIQRTRPFAVDVSGGVESDRGIKDHNKIKAFVREVLSA